MNREPACGCRYAHDEIGVDDSECQFPPLAMVLKDIERLKAQRNAVLEALDLFMKGFGNGTFSSSSKRAQQYRSDMWDKANTAVAKARG